MKLYYDNKATINTMHNLVHHDKTEHVAINKYFITENIKSGVICTPYIPIKKQ